MNLKYVPILTEVLRFYVNLSTKVSQWELPNHPAYPPPSEAPARASSPQLPNYSGSGPTFPEKGGALNSNNPYSHTEPQHSTETDAQLAARLQAEEDERAGAGSRGAADSYYGASGPVQQQQQQQQGGYYDQNQLPQREEGKGKRGLGGFLSKLSGKASGSSHGAHGGGYGGYGPPQQGYGGYPPQQGYGHGGYPPQQGYGYSGGHGGGGFGGFGGHGGGHGGFGGHGGGRKPGMGAAGGAALGLGAGLVGGALVADAIDDHDDYGGDDFGGD